MRRRLLPILLVAFALSAHAQRAGAKSVRLYPVERNGLYGYINGSGQVIIKPRFDEARTFSEGLAAVLVGDKWGYIDETGKFAIKPRYFSAGPFKEGLAAVGAYFASGPVDGRVGTYGYIDRVGALVVKPQFGVAFSFVGGAARVQTSEYKNGYIDRAGRILFLHDWLTEEFSDGLALFKTHGNMPGSKTGYLDKSGKVAISPRYDWGETFAEGVACVSQNGKAGFIDTKGDVAIDFRFQRCASFSEGLAAVMTGEGWGYIDKAGRFVIEPRFDEAKDFSDGLAAVRDGLVWGYVDKTGKLVIAPQFSETSDFANGVAKVNTTDEFGTIELESWARWAYINKSGTFIWRSEN
jgi:hypothetical protein